MKKKNPEINEIEKSMKQKTSNRKKGQNKI